MIRFMLVRDLTQFSAIYLVFLHAFAQCFFFINFNSRQEGRNATSDSLSLGPLTVVERTELAQSSGQMGTNKSLEQKGEIWRGQLLEQLFGQYARLCLELFKMTLGVYDLEPFRHSVLARLFFLLFMYLVPILFNM